MMKRRFYAPAVGLPLVTGLIVALSYAGQGGNGGGGGRLSPASLDIDTCGCPSWFGDPTCEERTHWSIDKTADIVPGPNPAGDPFAFTITVTEGVTEQILSGSGQLIITNSGEQTTFLSSIAVNLEEVWTGNGPSPTPAPGPSGKNWVLLATAIQNESSACADMGVAVTCYGDLFETEGASLVLYDPDTNDVIALTGDLVIPPTADNDGDGLRDEDPVLVDPLPNPNANSCDIHDNDGDGLYDEDPGFGAEVGIDNDGDGLIDEDPIDFDMYGNPIDNDGDGLFNEDDPDDDGDGVTDEDGPDDDRDGLIDEDGACEDAVIINFEYEFDIAGLGIEGPGDGIVPSEDDLRIDLVATFASGGRRGGTCTADVDCDGVPDEHVRSIQQRLRFDPVGCTPVCECVTLTDDGAAAADPNCVDVVNLNTLDEDICATGVEGTTTVRQVMGLVSCLGNTCETLVTNTAELTCDDPELIEGSPASASFTVVCEGGGGGGGGCPPFDPGDFCSQTQGGWGTANCNGNNTACLRDTYFSTVFPTGLIVGDPDGIDGDGCYAILLETAQDVADYLPAGGPPAVLTADQTNPNMTSAGVFGGQIVAATLNVAFDAAGYGKCTLTNSCSFPYPPGTLGQLIYVNCVDEYFIGMSVNEVLAEANEIISGCGTLPAGVTVSDYSDALAALNENFVDCDTNLGCLYFAEGCEIEWPVGGTMSVAFEDLPICGSNDWDYNDLVVDIQTVGTFGLGGFGDLQQMKFTFNEEAKIAGYTHVMHFAADTFGCDGTYGLYRNGAFVENGNYVDAAGIDVVVIANSSNTSSTAELTFTFPGGCGFGFPAWDPALVHGENLFFDPYIHVNNTGDDIHTGDIRMLTVPIDWQWPGEGQRIWNVYDCVTEGTGPDPACPNLPVPVFVPDWWMDTTLNGVCELP